MRRLVILAVLASVLASPGVASAFGYRDTGFDPDDVPLPYDIRSSTRKVWVNARGHRFLAVTIRTFEPLEDYWKFWLRLDSRGGQLTDYRMWWIGDRSDAWYDCYVWPASSRTHSMQGSLHYVGDRVSCRIPLRWTHPTKRIRWKVIHPADEGSGDYAPNGRGWYV